MRAKNFSSTIVRSGPEKTVSASCSQWMRARRMRTAVMVAASNKVVIVALDRRRSFGVVTKAQWRRAGQTVLAITSKQHSARGKQHKRFFPGARLKIKPLKIAKCLMAPLAHSFQRYRPSGRRREASEYFYTSIADPVAPSGKRVGHAILGARCCDHSSAGRACAKNVQTLKITSMGVNDDA